MTSNESPSAANDAGYSTSSGMCGTLLLAGDEQVARCGLPRLHDGLHQTYFRDQLVDWTAEAG